jgi:hypothetical protein
LKFREFFFSFSFVFPLSAHGEGSWVAGCGTLNFTKAYLIMLREFFSNFKPEKRKTPLKKEVLCKFLRELNFEEIYKKTSAKLLIKE